MMLKRISFLAIFLLLTICASAQRADLDSNKKADVVYTDSIKHYKKTKQKKKYRAIKREYREFNKRTRYRYPDRSGLHVSYIRQRIGIRKHEAISHSKSFFVNGINLGILIRISKPITLETGFALMGNKKNTPNTMNGFAEARAGDGMTIATTKITDGTTSLLAPYFQTSYKKPLNDAFTFESFLRISLNRLYVSHNNSYLLVSKTSNYNEIVTTLGYESLSLAFQPGVGISGRINNYITLVARSDYSFNFLQAKLLKYNPKLLNITSSNEAISTMQEFETPKIKNGIGVSIGVHFFFNPYTYPREKNYNKPTYYDRHFY